MDERTSDSVADRVAPQVAAFAYMPLGLFGAEVHAEVRPPWVALSKWLRLPLLRKHGRLRHEATTGVSFLTRHQRA